MIENRNQSKDGYYSEIDGLRAVAVLLVVLFHLKVPYFGGGFVGVDVFFVISGFLITKLIVGQIRKEQFSLVDFFVRRVRRLFPALFAVMFVVFVAGSVVFSPGALKELSAAILATLLFSSNILLYSQVDYFDVAAELKPLLHTWSLSVEEQFYLVWPFLIVGIVKLWGVRRINLSLFVFSILSLILSILICFVWSDSSLAFFMMPTRAWQFGVGALLGLYFDRVSSISVRNRDILAFVGLMALAWCSVAISSTDPYPDLVVLVPTVATALMILGNSSKYYSRVMLNSFLNYCGKISYSLYLVHWPLISFWAYHTSRELNAMEKGIIFFLSFLCAHLLNLFIEQKFRISTQQQDRPRRKLMLPVAVAMLMLGCIVGFAYYKDGFEFRIDENYAHLYKSIKADDRKFNKSNYGGSGYSPYNQHLGSEKGLVKKKVLVIGDSHARHYAYGLDTILSETKTDISVTMHSPSNCFFFDETKYTLKINKKQMNGCKKGKELAFANIHEYSAVIVAQSWPGYKSLLVSTVRGGGDVANTDDEFQSYLEDNIAHLNGKIAMNTRKILVGATPQASSLSGLLECFFRPFAYILNCEAKVKVPWQDTLGFKINQTLQKIAQKQNWEFFDPYGAFCGNGYCMFMEDGDLLYSDPHHLSRAGSVKATTYLINKINLGI